MQLLHDVSVIYQSQTALSVLY
uniref:Uncharacterized protein n=1 Tax=Rhizophora mucronata TaxID=61149 RepID=A0A2P2PK51_RHIMU